MNPLRRIVILFPLMGAAPAVLAGAAGTPAGPVQTLHVTGWLGFDGSVVWPLETFPTTPPTLAALSPVYVTAGKGDFTLTLDGTFFNSASTVRWNGADRPTQYVNPTQLTAAITAEDIASAGVNQVMVVNPGGPKSNVRTVTAVPLPTVNGFRGLLPFTPLNATVILDVQGASEIDWLFVPASSAGLGIPAVSAAFGIPGTPAARSLADTAGTPMKTQSPALSLTLLPLSPGPVKIQATAFNLAGDSALPAEGATTLVADDLSGVRVYPNPWRSDHDGDIGITFDRLPAEIKIRLFDVSGLWIRELRSPGGSVTWDLKNDAGDRVASGIYLFVITDEQGQKRQGKFVIIK